MKTSLWDRFLATTFQSNAAARGALTASGSMFLTQLIPAERRDGHALVVPGELCWAFGKPSTITCGVPSREDVFFGVSCRCELGSGNVDQRAVVMRNNLGGAEMTTLATEPLRTLTARLRRR